MTTAKKTPATTSENAAPDASPKAPAVQEIARPVHAAAEVTKSASKKPASKKAAPKKSAIAKAPAPRKAAVKKTAAKRPLSKAFAPAKVEKAAKSLKKPKLVRDSFTIPKAEYMVLDELKQRAMKLTRPVKKSELIRAGIKVLAALSNATFLTALEQVPAIKTGRPTLDK